MITLRNCIIGCCLLLLACCNDSPVFDVMFTDVTLFSDNTQEIAHAVVYKEHAEELVFMSVAHYFENTKGPYRISLDNLPIVRMWRPESDRDVVFFTVSRKGLKRGKDYEVPDFTLNNVDMEKVAVVINRDQMYGIRPRKIISPHKNDPRTWLVSDVVEKGRSGTPVFIKGTNQCLGIVRGYLEKERQTVVVAP